MSTSQRKKISVLYSFITINNIVVYMITNYTGEELGDTGNIYCTNLLYGEVINTKK